MADDINQVIEYLQTHRGEYDQATLRARLLADGVAPATVDAALAEVFGAVPQIVDAQAPTVGAAPEESLAQVVAYIQANRSTYDRVALRARLIQDGVAPAQADLALAQVYGYQELGVAPSLAQSNRANRLVIIVTLAFNVAASCGFFGLLGGIFSNASSAISQISPLFIPLAEIVVGVVLIMRGKKAVGKGILYGLLWTVLGFVALVALIYGLCTGLLN